VTLAPVVADFAPASPPQALADDEIHVWFFPRWERTPDAAQSAPVRSLLGAYLDQPGASVRIERGEHGKPRVADARLEFNLSHAGTALLLAVSRRIALGIDLESIRRKTRPAVELARRFFTSAEARAVEALPPDRRQDTFLRLWCAKEAALKAHGRGIGFGLDRFEFALDAEGGVAPVAGNPWRIVALAPSPEYVGTLAWRGPVSRVRAFVAEN
jgi:4'-phosphopantetheinyl transferase